MTTHKVWKINPPSPLTSKLAFDAGLSPLQAQLFINRGISDSRSVQTFMNPQLSDLLDPMLFKDMDRALMLILKAAENGERITIFGDYDADGLTATALLVNFFSGLGLPVSYYIPNRMDEGYGLNKKAIKKIKHAGTGLIVTVDCGSANEQEIDFAQSLGLNVVVTDHHQTLDTHLPKCPLINPHQPGCPFPFKDLAGVGVAFFLAVAVRAVLRQKGWFKTRSEPDLRDYLDLVSLGTVGDRVRLLGQNRILVSRGIEVMAGTRWAGLEAMKEASNVGGPDINAEDLAFRLVPRLNAPGRISDPEIGIRILTANEPIFAKNLALRINAINHDRQAIEKAIFERIEHIIETRGGIGDRRVLFMGAEDWHRGVLGIVASRLVDKYYRPSFVFNTSDGFAVGSGRSIDGFNLFKILSRFNHLFEKFGGHTHAAGFTIKLDRLRILEKELDAVARESLTDSDLVPTIVVDAELLLEDVTPETISRIRALSPFGQGNPEPCFLGRSLNVFGSRIVGERHLKFKVRQGEYGRAFDAIGFGHANKYPLDGKTLDMVFTPEINQWQGHESVQLKVVDIRDADFLP